MVVSGNWLVTGKANIEEVLYASPHHLPPPPCLCICSKLIFLCSAALASLKLTAYKFNHVYVDLFMAVNFLLKSRWMCAIK